MLMAQSQLSEPPILDTWVEETVSIPVKEPQYDPETGKTKVVETQKEFTQKSYYTNPPSRKVICAQHVYRPHDTKRYIFKCQKCAWHFQAFHPTHKYDPETGYLTHRRTGERM